MLHQCTCTCIHNPVSVSLQLSGLGKLRPNTVVIGYKTNWKTSTEQEIEEYVNIIQ